MKVELTLDKDKLRAKVAKNLNITDTSMGSYLHTLIDGISEVNELTLAEVNKHIANMYLETADADHLERYGANKGVPRLKSRLAFSKVTNSEISLEPHFFVYTKDLNLKLFAKGESIDVDIMRITFLEDVDFNSNAKKVYVSCQISVGSVAGISTSYLKEGKSFTLEVPNKYKTVFSSMTLNIESPMGFTDYEENLETYRAKLLALATSENITSKDTVERVISTSQGVYKYFVDNSVYPTKVYYLSPLMYYKLDYESLVESTENYLRLHTDMVRGFTSNFEFSLPEAVWFKMNIITADDAKLRKVLEDFINSFVTNHTLGYELVIDKTYLTEFLKAAYPEFNQMFEVEFYYTDGLLNAPTETRNSIVINPDSYPKLYGITINGDYNETLPYI